MKCFRQGCENEAEVVPVLLMYAVKGGVAAEARVDIPVCGQCAVQSKVEDFMNDEGWRHMVAAFRRRSVVVPKRELTEVRFARL